MSINAQHANPDRTHVCGGSIHHDEEMASTESGWIAIEICRGCGAYRYEDDDPSLDFPAGMDVVANSDARDVGELRSPDGDAS